MICATVAGAVIGGIFAISMAQALHRQSDGSLQTYEDILAYVLRIMGPSLWCIPASMITNEFVARHYGNVASVISLLLTMPMLLLLTIAVFRGPSVTYWLTFATIDTVTDIIVWAMPKRPH